MKFAKGIFEKYKLNVAKFTTKASLAMGAFTLTLPREFLYVNTPLFDEIIRKAYFGGRTDAQSPFYESSWYEEIIDTLESSESKALSEDQFAEIDDYLCYLDVNSLYPAVMFSEKMPVGVPKMWNVCDQSELNSLNCGTHEELWHRRILLVDVVCPKNIITPYLFERDEKGKLSKNLRDKIKVWYCGVDLLEATLLGYRVVKVHQIIEWPDSDYIFKEFIGKEWADKVKASRGTVLYMLAKLLMNSLSGKFAQRSNERNVSILVGDALCKGIHDPSSVTGFDVLCDGNEEKVIAVILERFECQEWSKYPVYISCFILAHSRALMSKYLRMVNGYHSIEDSFLYTDTDSLVLKNNAIEKLKSYIGKDLGFLSDELDGGKIVKATFLAPKTYQLVWIDEKYHRLKVTTKCKGIPHIGSDLNAFEDYTIKDENVLKKVELIRKWLNGSASKDSCPNVEFKKPYYIIEDSKNSNNYEVTSCLGLDVFEGVLAQDLKVCCLFGSMVKQFGATSFSGKGYLNVYPTYRQRGLNVVDWWEKSDRIVMEINGVLHSVPKLYNEEEIVLEEELNIEEDMILEALKLNK
jgi:hypothetical protein